MKKAILNIFALCCFLFITSCSSGPEYTCRELFNRPKISKRSTLLERVILVVKVKDKLCLGGTGISIDDKIYVNAPDRKPQEMDKVIIWQKKDENSFYLFYSEGKKGNLERKHEAIKWCEENIQ